MCAYKDKKAAADLRDSIQIIVSIIFIYVLSYLQNIDFYKRDGYFYSTLKIIFFVKNGKRDNHFSPFTNGMRIFIKIVYHLQIIIKIDNIKFYL